MTYQSNNLAHQFGNPNMGLPITEASFNDQYNPTHFISNQQDLRL